VTARPVRQLVVTADDFGLSIEVNEAVERAHREGILTAASLMVSGRAAGDAVRRAKRLPGLRVGLHVVLRDGVPTLGRAMLSDLVGADGRLRSDWVLYGAHLLFSPRARRQLALEVSAQFAAFRGSGLELDHVDAHGHFHLHPLIAGEVIRNAAGAGVAFVRAPREPAGVLNRIEAPRRRLRDVVVARFARMLAVRVGRAGLRTPDQVFGVAWSGAMTQTRLLQLMAHLPEGLSEIYTHPATSDAFEGAAAGYRYVEEFAALTAPEVVEAVEKSAVRLGGFTDFR
jgi:hopanoid biosynthesis associated protein HpnK